MNPKWIRINTNKDEELKSNYLLSSSTHSRSSRSEEVKI